MTGITKECSGKTSSSRIVVLASFSLIGLTWITIIVGIMLDKWEWNEFEESLDWAVNFLLISVLPYIGNKIGGALGKKNGDDF